MTSINITVYQYITAHHHLLNNKLAVCDIKTLVKYHEIGRRFRINLFFILAMGKRFILIARHCCVILIMNLPIIFLTAI